MPPGSNMPMTFATRIATLAWILPSLVLLAGCPRPAGDAPGGSAAAGSVLLITLDTTRADRLGPYGATGVETPALSALAATGVVFERAYAVAPVTAPTHASLLTGLYPQHHGVRQNGIHYLEPRIETLAERLSASGRRTAAVISAAVLERRYGLDQGFELYDDDLTEGGGRMEMRTMIERPAAATVERALSWLEELAPGEPFFLWVHLFDPHAPYLPPSPWAERYADRPYDGELAYMDSQIGRLLRHPRVAERETIVAAIGDHGESLGQHGERTHGLLIYDATLRVPWIMRLPLGSPGTRLSEPVSQIDLLPTLLAALGLDAAPQLDGLDLLPLIAGRSPELERILYAESETPFHAYGWAKLHSVRAGALKYIDAPEEELYDLVEDPEETRNLAAERTAEAGRMAAELVNLSVDASASGPALDPDTEAEEKLRALGYVGGARGRPAGGGHGDPKRLIALHETLQRAGVLIEKGRPDEALVQLDGVLEGDPRNLAALLAKARALMDSARLPEARRAAKTACAAAPWSPVALMTLAEVRFREGAAADAVDLAGQALELDPRYREARMERARFLARAGRGDEAAAELARLREAGANDPWIDVRQVEVIDLPARDYAGAERRLRGTVTRDPYLARAWLLLGESLERQNRPAEALAAYRAGLERIARHPGLTGRLALLMARETDPGAIEALREAIAVQATRRADLHLALAERLAAAGREEEAREELVRAAESGGESPAALNDRARALARLGRTEEAAAAWRSLTRARPEFAPAWNNLAALAVQRGAWDEAEKLSRRAAEGDPDNAAAWNNLGIALDELHRSGEAEAAYRQALEIDAGFWKAGFNLALLLREGARYEEAVPVLESVLARVPSHAGAHFELGMLYAGPLADPGRARSHLEASLRSEPDHPRARLARQVLEQL